MNEQAKLKLHGAMTAYLFKEDGSVETHHKDNIVVAVGFDFIANAIGNATRPAAMGYVAVGTGTNAAAAGDTALQTELNRQAATFAHTAGSNTFSFTANFAAGVATGAITEAGVLNASVAGTLLDHVVFPVINKGSADTLQMVFTFTMS